MVGVNRGDDLVRLTIIDADGERDVPGLAPLVRERSGRARWILDLHDAYVRDDFGDQPEHEAFAHDVARYDAVTVCSAEDLGLIAHPRAAIVANGWLL